MVFSNYDIVCTVAEHVEPNPVVYFNSMAVNKQFYAVFSSDKAWRYLNPYNCANKIIQSFRDNTSAADREMIRANLPLHDIRRSVRSERTHGCENGTMCFRVMNKSRVESRLSSSELWTPSRLSEIFRQPLFLEQTNPFVMLDLLACSLLMWDLPLIENRQIFKCAVQINPFAVAHFCINEKRDRELCVKAAILNSSAVTLMEGAFRLDKQFYLETIEKGQSTFCQCIIARELRGDEDLNLAVMRRGPIDLRALVHTPQFRDSERLKHAAVNAYPELLVLCPADLQDNTYLVRLALRAHPASLKYASERLRDDKSLVMDALKRNYSTFYTCSPRLQEDLDVAKTILNAQKGECQLMGLSRAVPHLVCRTAFSEKLKILWGKDLWGAESGKKDTCSGFELNDRVRRILVNGAGAIRMLRDSNPSDWDVTALDTDRYSCSDGYGVAILQRYAQGRDITIPEELLCSTVIYLNAWSRPKLKNYKAWRTHIPKIVADRLENEPNLVRKLVRKHPRKLRCKQKTTGSNEEDVAVLIVRGCIFSGAVESRDCTIALAIKYRGPRSSR